MYEMPCARKICSKQPSSVNLTSLNLLRCLCGVFSPPGYLPLILKDSTSSHPEVSTHLIFLLLIFDRCKMIETLRRSLQFPHLAHYEFVPFINRPLTCTLLCARVLSIWFTLFSQPTVNLSVAKDTVTNAWIENHYISAFICSDKRSAGKRRSLPVVNI